MRFFELALGFYAAYWLLVLATAIIRERLNYLGYVALAFVWALLGTVALTLLRG